MNTKIVLVLLAVAAVLFAGCAIPEPTDSYNEASEDTNITLAAAEATGFDLELYQNYRINGVFDSGDDVDYFSVDLTTVTDPYSCSFRVAHNGNEVTGDIILEFNYFPLNVYFYDVDGIITGTQYLWAASGDGVCEVPDDAVEMVVYVYGDSEIELLGTPLPYTSGEYYVQFYVD